MILSKQIAKENVAANIRRLMDDRNLTQVQLADAAGISQPFVHKLLHGKALPNAVDLRNVAEVLGVSSDDLMESSLERKLRKIG